MTSAPSLLHVLSASGLFLAAGVAPALDIVLDYSSDAAAMNFFGQRPVAKLAVDAAAAHLSALLGPTALSAIGPTGVPNVNQISGVNGSTTVTADWDLIYTDPSTGVDVTLGSPVLAANAVRIYVGTAGLGLGILGQGYPGGADLLMSAGGFGSQLAGAVANLEAASNAYMGRGSGPVISTFSDTITLGANSASFSLILGATFGQLSFNTDTDADGFADSLAVLDSYWHYDHTTAVGVGKSDLYSVALHEMMHALGFGASDTWSSLVSGTTWLGTHAAALNGGSGANLLDADGAHLRGGLMSTNLYTGLAQEAALDPQLTTGTRKQLTAMDAAILEDLGYVVAPAPEPGGMMLFLAGVAGLTLGSRRRPARV